MNKQKTNIWRIIIGGAIGNFSEWYNFLLYGYLASEISQLFFPLHNKLLSLTLTFTVFALSFIVRPIGGILFGWIGDTYGRRRALILSILLMGIPTFLISFLPTYQSIGIASPLVFCLLRICQGLSAGGEHTGSAIYIAEYAPKNRYTLWISTVPMSAALGVLMSSVFSLLLVQGFSEEQLLSWGWRLGYWIGTALCVISFILRMALPETPIFEKMHKGKTQHHLPLSTLFSHSESLRSLFFVFVLASTWGVFYQIIFIWMPTYLSKINHFSHSKSLLLNNVFLALFIGLILCVGWLSDYLNRKKILIFACCGIFIFAYPIFILLSAGSLFKIVMGMSLFTFLFSLFIPTSFSMMVEAFNTSVRYTGFSFGFNSGLAIFGGTCPLIVTWPIEITQSNISPAFYTMFFAVCGILAVGLMKDQTKTTLTL